MDRRRAAMNPWPIVLLILVLCCAIAFGCASIGARLFSKESFGSVRAIDITNLQKLETTSDGFVYYDGSVVSAISSSGSVRWSNLVGGGADFSASDAGVAAWVDDRLWLFDPISGAVSFNSNMDAPILSARMDENYTAVLTGEETNCAMNLMAPGGKQVSRIVLEDVTAVDYGFFSNGSLLWIMVMDTNGTAPTCTIQTYRPGKEIVGSIHDNEQLSYAVLFQSTQVLVAGDSFLKTYDYTGVENKERRRLIYGWKLADYDHGSIDPLMALVNDAQCAGESNIQDVRMLRSDLDRVVRLPFGCMEVCAVGNSIYGFSSSGQLMVYPADAQTAQIYQLNLRIGSVYGITRDGVAVLGSGNSVYLVNME